MRRAAAIDAMEQYRERERRGARALRERLRHARLIAERLVCPKEFPTPHKIGAAEYPALARLLHHEAAVEKLLAGLVEEYAVCSASGRIDLWARAARAIVTVIESRAETPMREKEPGQLLAAQGVTLSEPSATSPHQSSAGDRPDNRDTEAW